MSISIAELKSEIIRLRLLEKELRAELETERMRLAACGVVAMANTPKSAARERNVLPEYRSGSLDDVIRIVDSEMKLRAENEALRAKLELLLDFAQTVGGSSSFWDEVWEQEPQA